MWLRRRAWRWCHERGVAAKLGVGVVVIELGVIVTKRAPSSVASLPRLASSPKRGVIVTERAPSGVVLLPSGVVSLPSGVALLPKRGVAIIVAAINDGATTKQCFVGVGSASRLGVTQRGSKYLLGGNNE